MRAIELNAEVDQDRRIHLELPEGVPAGPARVLVLLPEVDEVEGRWQEMISREWRSELSDPREDIYTLDDGEPVG